MKPISPSSATISAFDIIGERERAARHDVCGGREGQWRAIRPRGEFATSLRKARDVFTFPRDVFATVLRQTPDTQVISEDGGVWGDDTQVRVVLLMGEVGALAPIENAWRRNMIC